MILISAVNSFLNGKIYQINHITNFFLKKYVQKAMKTDLAIMPHAPYV